MSDYTQIEKYLVQVLESQERLETKLSEIEENLLRIEEGIANVSLPGSGYSIERYDEE